MTHHDRHGSPSRFGGQRPRLPQTPVPEETLRTEKLQVERKTFILMLKENPRGRFLRITEDVGGRRDHIIVPSSGLADFRRVLDEMIRTDQETPAKIA
jgi:hypothetical protein